VPRTLAGQNASAEKTREKKKKARRGRPWEVGGGGGWGGLWVGWGGGEGKNGDKRPEFGIKWKRERRGWTSKSKIPPYNIKHKAGAAWLAITQKNAKNNAETTARIRKNCTGGSTKKKKIQPWGAEALLPIRSRNRV